MRISIPKFHCEIILTQQSLNGLIDYLSKSKGNYSACAIISHPQIFSLYGKSVEQILQKKGIPVSTLLIPSGESYKALDQVNYCWDEMFKAGLDRKSFVIGLGGGVITDLAGFTAACYMRGIDHFFIPTTLLGMVDASIGGKNGVNLPAGKNLIGTICHPRLVLIVPEFLASLPDRELRSGLAEVIKAGVIWDAELFEILEHQMPGILSKEYEKIKTIIARACKIKAEVIRIDEKEQNLRSILNYGHTFAHAIETATEYNKFTHGEAVSIGMHCAACVSRHLGYVDNEFLRRQDALCQAAGLPTAIPKDISLKTLIGLMQKDKKAISGKITLIVPRKIGKVDKISDIDPKVITEALEKF